MNNEMTLQDAIKIVEEYQKWRTSEPPYDEIRAPLNYTPKEISLALNILLEEARKHA